MIYLAWIFGIGGIVANILIFQQKNRKNLLRTKLLADISWTIHYSFLSAWSGAAVCGIGIIRESVFLQKPRKWANSPLWLILFFLCSLVSAVLTWKSPFSILPAVASMLSILSFWIGNPKLSRWLQIPISLSFFTYNVTVFSVTGIINELLTMISIAIAVWRLSKHADR
jgi:hypothetical protein